MNKILILTTLLGILVFGGFGIVVAQVDQGFEGTIITLTPDPLTLNFFVLEGAASSNIVSSAITENPNMLNLQISDITSSFSDPALNDNNLNFGVDSASLDTISNFLTTNHNIDNPFVAQLVSLSSDTLDFTGTITYTITEIV